MVSKYRNMGQTCVCANRLYAQDKIYDQFVEKLSKKVAAMKIGDGTEAGVTQGPLIDAAAVEKLLQRTKIVCVAAHVDRRQHDILLRCQLRHDLRLGQRHPERLLA